MSGVRSGGRVAWRSLSCVALMAAGCTATLVPPDGLSDARTRTVELEREVQQLQAANAELHAQLAAAEERKVDAALASAAGAGVAAAGGGAAGAAGAASAGAAGAASAGAAVDPELAAATPRMVLMVFAGGSAEWTKPAADGFRDGVVHLAVEPRDGRGRALQVAGRCEVTVACVNPGGGVTELGRAALAPLELRAAWRNGFMGTHYSIDVPVRVPAGMADGIAWTASISLRDGWTGVRSTATGSVMPPR